MQLEHSFTVPVGIDEAWRVLTDIGAIAPCMPGSKVAEADTEHATGTLKVKLGPLNLTYQGSARLIESDPSAHRAVIAADGADARNGSATATVVATLADDSGTTIVELVTDLEVTGKPAQFAQGVMADVGTKLVGQFARKLTASITEGSAAPGSGGEPSTTQPSRTKPAERKPRQTKPSQPTPRPQPRKATVESAPATADTIPSVNGHGSATPPPPPSGGLGGLLRPAMIRGVAPAALAALIVVGALRRRRHRRG